MCLPHLIVVSVLLVVAVHAFYNDLNVDYELMFSKRNSKKTGKHFSALDDHCVVNPFPAGRIQMLPFGRKLTKKTPLVAKNSKLEIADGSVKIVHLSSRKILWDAKVNVSDSAYVYLTNEGLGVFDNNKILWITQQNFSNTSVLTLHDNCNLGVYQNAPFAFELWSTKTSFCVDFHIVPHSHDDVGWLLTPEKYFDGCHHPGHGVQAIITTMVETLYANANRTFSQVESYYFHRWWLRQSENMKAKARYVVMNGQMELVNIGWSMHDEGCVHQESAIANMARGAQFMRKIFGTTSNVTIGWHIDPFGHASATPLLMAQMGFNALFLQRQDFQQREVMMKTKTLETMWENSDSLDTASMMFTSIMPDTYHIGCNNNMCPTPYRYYTCDGMSWIRSPQELVVDFENKRKQSSILTVRNLFRLAENSPLTVNNIADKVIAEWFRYANHYRTDQVLIPWGDDFEHNDAWLSFGLMDTIIKTLRTDPKYSTMNIFYSTPRRYIDSIIAQNYSWPVNHYDYFLNSDDLATMGYAYWSGYLSSRMEYKRFERDLMNRRSTSEMMLSSIRPDSCIFIIRWHKIDVLRQALGVAQHHDSITGTERSYVRDHYNYLLARGMSAADNAMSSMLEEITGLTGVTVCPLMNISQCLSTGYLDSSEGVSIIIYNSQQKFVNSEVLKIPCPISNLTVEFIDPIRNYAPLHFKAFIQETWELTTTPDPNSPHLGCAMPFELMLQVSMAPESISVLKLHRPSGDGDGSVDQYSSSKLTAPEKISNNYYELTIDPKQGLTHIVNTNNNVSSSLSAEYLWYWPRNSSNGQAAGAYIFKANSHAEKPIPFQTPTFTKAVKASNGFCKEIRMYGDSASAIHQTIRVCDDEPFVHIITGVGEVDAGAVGKEVIIRYKTQVANRGIFYTDSQGLEMQKRVRGKRPNYPYNNLEPVASNFFPSNQWCMIKDSNVALALVSDSSRAVSSMEDGEVEQIIARRLLFDDSRGVGQPLDEKFRVISDTLLIYDMVEPATTVARLSALKLTHPPLVFFSNDTVLKSYPGILRNEAEHYTALLRSPLPNSIHLHSREMLDKNTMLIRLQHIFSVGESSVYSKPVTVDLQQVLPAQSAIFGAVKIASVTEMDLNGVSSLDYINNHQRVQFNSCDLNTGKTFLAPTAFKSSFVKNNNTNSTLVTLNPMEIRTYKVVVNWE